MLEMLRINKSIVTISKKEVNLRWISRKNNLELIELYILLFCRFQGISSSTNK